MLESGPKSERVSECNLRKVDLPVRSVTPSFVPLHNDRDLGTDIEEQNYGTSSLWMIPI